MFLGLAVCAGLIAIGFYIISQAAVLADTGLGALTGGIGEAVPKGAPKSANEVVSLIFNVVIGLSGAIFMVLLLIGGVNYLTGSGDEEKTGKAKKLLLDAVIGLFITLAAWGIGVWALGKFGWSATGGGGGGGTSQSLASDKAEVRFAIQGSDGGNVKSLRIDGSKHELAESLIKINRVFAESKNCELKYDKSSSVFYSTGLKKGEICSHQLTEIETANKTYGEGDIVNSSFTAKAGSRTKVIINISGNTASLSSTTETPTTDESECALSDEQLNILDNPVFADGISEENFLSTIPSALPNYDSTNCQSTLQSYYNENICPITSEAINGIKSSADYNPTNAETSFRGFLNNQRCYYLIYGTTKPTAGGTPTPTVSDSGKKCDADDIQTVFNNPSNARLKKNDCLNVVAYYINPSGSITAECQSLIQTACDAKFGDGGSDIPTINTGPETSPNATIIVRVRRLFDYTADSRTQENITISTSQGSWPTTVGGEMIKNVSVKKTGDNLYFDAHLVNSRCSTKLKDPLSSKDIGTGGGVFAYAIRIPSSGSCSLIKE